MIALERGLERGLDRWLLLSLERGCLDRTLDRRQLSRALERGLERGLDMWLLSRLWKGVLIGPTLDRGGRSCSETATTWLQVVKRLQEFYRWSVGYRRPGFCCVFFILRPGDVRRT